MADAAAVEDRLSSGFERELFRAALQNGAEENNPLRAGNFAYAIRELSRHVLIRLAPDDCVLKCGWYENETDKPNQITRRQRIAYAVHGGLDQEFVENKLEIDVKQLEKEVRDAIDDLNKFTHIGPHTFGADPALADDLMKGTLAALRQLFDTMEECRARIVAALEHAINKEVLGTFLNETFDELDELATHHYVDGVEVDEVEVEVLDHAHVMLRADGHVHVTLQYGSGSDVRSGMGDVSNDSYPFTCEVRCSVVDSLEFTGASKFKIDTSSFYE